MPEGTDLLFAILYAGGYTENSKLNGISIRRRNVKDLIEVDLEDLIEDGKVIPKLLDGDIITIPYNLAPGYRHHYPHHRICSFDDGVCPLAHPRW